MNGLYENGVKEAPKLFHNISWQYEQKQIFSSFSYCPHEGKITSIIGKSGTGKTTLLKLAAQLLKPIEGTVQVPKGNLSYVFQEPRLLPWYTIDQNLLWLLPKCPEQIERVHAMLANVGLEDCCHLYPMQLSGGMQQRVSLARAFLFDAELLLLDEPFKGLDADTKEEMYQILKDYWRRKRATILLVTHDLAEAKLLGHRIVHLQGNPVTLFEEVGNEWS